MNAHRSAKWFILSNFLLGLINEIVALLSELVSLLQETIAPFFREPRHKVIFGGRHGLYKQVPTDNKADCYCEYFGGH